MYTLDFTNLLKAVSLKLSGELAWFYLKAFGDER